MRDPKKREMLQALYRWAERYEEVPRIDPLDHEAAGINLSLSRDADEYQSVPNTAITDQEAVGKCLYPWSWLHLSPF